MSPNVLLIVVDDLGYADLSAVGMAEDVHTPNMDRLIHEGLFYSNAYATAPICNASRIALQTGRYQQRFGTFWYGSEGIPDDGDQTLAERLSEAGYSTAYVGKFHHGKNDDPQGRGYPLNHGFEYLFGFAGGTKHYLRHKREYVPAEGENDLLYQGPMYRMESEEDIEGFSTELFGREARMVIQKRNPSKPFFLQLSFNAVHNYVHQLPDDYLTQHGLSKFPDWDSDLEDYWDWRKKIGYPAHSDGRGYYLGQLHLLDLEIGRIYKQLELDGLLDNTVIIFASDNGGSLVTYANNTPLSGGKYTLQEGGIRVPMVIRAPANLSILGERNEPVSLLDVYPTICGLVGLESSKNLDGEDLLRIAARDLAQGSKRNLYWDTTYQEAVRYGKWKLLITHSDPNPRLQISETPKGKFLYDLNVDAAEANDLSAKFPHIVKSLTADLREWQQSLTISSP